MKRDHLANAFPVVVYHRFVGHVAAVQICLGSVCMINLKLVLIHKRFDSL